MANESLHVAVVDIGNLKNLGWALKGPSGIKKGTDIDLCVEALVGAMKAGPLALGFEAPMFVPHGRELRDLDRGREGEGDRAFSAAPGACVLTKGLVIVPYILERIRRQTQAARPTFKWRERLSARDLLLFEAFVTHVDETSHVDCAMLALKQFSKLWEKRDSFDSAVQEPLTLNLLGAMLLRMEWTDDLAMLSEPCLAVRHKGNSN